jgi:hypothetical protein
MAFMKYKSTDKTWLVPVFKWHVVQFCNSSNLRI